MHSIYFFPQIQHIERDLHVFPDQEISKPKTEKNKIKIIIIKKAHALLIL